MMNAILVQVNDDTALRLRQLANANGVPLEEEASSLLDGAVKRADRLCTFLAEVEALSAGLPPQTTDSAVLIREDRDSLMLDACAAPGIPTKEDVKKAIAEIERLSQGCKLDGLSIKEMRHEGHNNKRI